ncbi:guanine deaminase [Guyanagaster necrorhizus]|uniref:Guanine deaminase n=1 Tax=Guyanagaster necrorhizus TaxID=856835 RepID=A0A9P7VWT5_9AGAR|nr:guanine deaminase [Guyanagaster necrorhizus MCA 3950]KAG7448002.1 guanine deaminase [Guyanagaster necrorhizus MCA 3950]
MSTTIYYGSVVNPVNLTSFQALPRCLLAVGATGCVEWLVEDVEDALVRETMGRMGCLDNVVIPLKETEFIMPGFIDTHTHAPQFRNIGSGQQYELLDWLSIVTFPTETKFADLDFARRTYSSVVRRIINNGTTTCCYYGTLHLEATKLLADIIKSYGQRAFVGKCNMDRNCPDYYVEPSAEASIDATESLISHIRSLDSNHTEEPLVQPILTPRFAISCSPPLLASLGKLVLSDSSLRIQTHISENESEIELTKELFPECPSYAHVYDSFGLLRSNTILAHAVHLEPHEMDLIAQRGAGISHCPTSNFNLSSGVAPVGEFLDRGIKVGLGTDVSGGYSPSILNSVQTASIAAKVVAMQAKGSKPTSGNFSDRQLSVATLLYLATLGGAEVCDLKERVGSFAPGKSFDALIVNVSDKGGNPCIWGTGEEEKGKAALEGMLERLLFCGDDRNIARVFIQGKLVGGTEF